MVARQRLSEVPGVGDLICDETDQYFQTENGNLYNKHCFYMSSGPLEAHQIHAALAEAFDHCDCRQCRPKAHEHCHCQHDDDMADKHSDCCRAAGFFVNTIRDSEGELQKKSYFWIDDDSECYRLFSGQVKLPAIELTAEQIPMARALRCLTPDGKFPVSYSGKFYTHNFSADDVDTQLFVGKLPCGDTRELKSMLLNIFSRYAVSTDDRHVKVEVFSCKDSRNSYAIVTFDNPFDCSYAIDMTHKCIIEYKGEEYTLSIRNAKRSINSSGVCSNGTYGNYGGYSGHSGYGSYGSHSSYGNYNKSHSRNWSTAAFARVDQSLSQTANQPTIQTASQTTVNQATVNQATDKLLSSATSNWYTRHGDERGGKYSPFHHYHRGSDSYQVDQQQQQQPPTRFSNQQRNKSRGKQQQQQYNLTFIKASSSKERW